MQAVFYILNAFLDIYWWIVIISVVLSWLYAFNVVNPGNHFVSMVGQFVHNVTEPMLSRIRRFMPDMGSVDLSPIVLLVGITASQIFLNTTVARAVGLYG